MQLSPPSTLHHVAQASLVARTRRSYLVVPGSYKNAATPPPSKVAEFTAEFTRRWSLKKRTQKKFKKWPCKTVKGRRLDEFKVRVKKVEKFMNSKKFKAKNDGGGLMSLANDLRSRCEDMKERQGERIPK